MGSNDEYLNSFPHPLSREEIFRLFEKYKRDNDYDAREKIIVHNLRLVAFIIGRYYFNTNCEFEELFSIGTYGLIKAVDSFDTRKNILFTTYSSKCIQNEILMHLRKEKKRIIPMSLEAPVNDDMSGDNFLCLEEMVADEDGITGINDQIELQASMQKINDYLSNRPEAYSKDVIEGLYGLNGKIEKTQKEVAAEVGLSQSYVSRFNKMILSDLKEVVK